MTKGVTARRSHRSWSGVGPVEAVAGDVITVDPCEMHDGHPVRRQLRSWRMLYFDPGLVAEAMREDMSHAPEFTLPAMRDPGFAARFARLFAAVVAPVPDAFAIEEGTVSTLAHMLARYGGHPCLWVARRPWPWR